MARQNKRRNSPWAIGLRILLGVASGVAAGLLLFLSDQKIQGVSGLLLLLAAVVVGQYIQIIAHESGHLIFGLLTGYRFLSFRIGSIMLTLENNRLVFRLCRVPGTAGQCLLMPPEGERIPYVLYHLGGVLANLLLTVLLAVGYYLYRPQGPLNYFWVFTMLFGAFGVVINGIPLRLNGVANDGYNALSLSRLPQARQALWAQLKLVGLSTQGVRMKDMPEELFTLPEQPDWEDPMVCAMVYMKVYRAIDGQQLKQAQAMAEEFLALETGMLDLHRNELLCELLFCELLGPCRRERVTQLYSHASRHIQATARNNISRCRLLYAKALLFDGDQAKAREERARFEALAKFHPYRGEVEGERELMALASQKAAERSAHIS